MKIVGGHDYYDSALAYGRDDSVVFVRHKDKRLEEAEIPFPYVANLHNIRDFGYYGYNINSTYLKPYSIIVAGKLYPMIAIDVYGKSPIFCYSYIELQQNLSKMLKWEEPQRRWQTVQDTKNFFEAQLTEKQKIWLIANKITIMHNHYINFSEYQFVFIGELREYRPVRNQVWLVDDFNLHSFQFQRKLDPYAANQEIAMYVGGVLTSSGNLMVEITDDKIKIHKAGFDVKSSFRKMKGE